MRRGGVPQPVASADDHGSWTAAGYPARRESGDRFEPVAGVGVLSLDTGEFRAPGGTAVVAAMRRAVICLCAGRHAAGSAVRSGTAGGDRAGSRDPRRRAYRRRAARRRRPCFPVMARWSMRRGEDRERHDETGLGGSTREAPTAGNASSSRTGHSACPPTGAPGDRDRGSHQ